MKPNQPWEEKKSFPIKTAILAAILIGVLFTLPTPSPDTAVFKPIGISLIILVVIVEAMR